jgi:hypothetical protein
VGPTPVVVSRNASVSQATVVEAGSYDNLVKSGNAGDESVTQATRVVGGSYSTI